MTLGLQSMRLAGRVAELESLEGLCRSNPSIVCCSRKAAVASSVRARLNALCWHI